MKLLVECFLQLLIVIMGIVQHTIVILNTYIFRVINMNFLESARQFIEHLFRKEDQEKPKQESYYMVMFKNKTDEVVCCNMGSMGWTNIVGPGNTIVMRMFDNVPKEQRFLEWRLWYKTKRIYGVVALADPSKDEEFRLRGYVELYPGTFQEEKFFTSEDWNVTGRTLPSFNKIQDDGK